MALIQCPECNNQISDTAPRCPQCGYQREAATIQETGKEWKGLQLIGGIMAIFGVPIAMLGGLVVPALSYASLTVMLAGMGMFTYARMMAWWHHG